MATTDPRPPLLVSIVFHPESTAARDLALSIHGALNSDPLVPGLRIPTAFCPTDGTRPQPLPFDLAQRHCVVVLADATLDAREGWSAYVGDQYERCERDGHRFVPLLLAESAYPLDPRLGGLSFARICQVDAPLQTAAAIRRVVIELSRFLSGDPGAPTDPAPVRVFVSHAKLDLDKPPRAAHAIVEHLRADQPVKAWVDSGDIASGSSFATAIADGIADTALLCVLTDSYASREWCRREILHAKAAQRPIVVVDALDRHEVRSFPYHGNVPVLRWSGDAAASIDLLLKENLHHVFTPLALERWRRPDDAISIRPPELATLVQVPAARTVLYPDPPLGREETELLERTGRSVATPLQRLAQQRRLDGTKIALSMSEPTDLGQRGLAQPHFDETVIDVSRYLLIEGATLAYGGHLGSGGYTLALAELIASHNDQKHLSPLDRLVNYVGWPLPRPTDAQVSEQKQGCRLVVVDRPADVDERLDPRLVAAPKEFVPASSPELRFAWARGMTTMRERQARDVAARIVLGGVFGPTVGVAPDGTRSEKWYSGRIPGVLEELLVSVQANQPVFLVGAFGGVAGLVADLLSDPAATPEPLTWAYQQRAPHAAALPNLYRERRLPWLDYPDIVAMLRQRGITGINPLLTEAEHRELFRARDPMRIVELILRGLAKLRP